MRDLCEVIDRIIEVIPDSETSTISKLKCVQNDCRYTAPELIPLKWQSVYGILCDYVFDPHTLGKDTWQEKIRKIFVGEK